MRNFKAVRQLRRSPGFVITMVVTLALAIGANTAIFSMLNALLLKQLPYEHPDRIGTVYVRVTGSKSAEEDGRERLDGEMWETLRDQVPSLMPAIICRRTWLRHSRRDRIFSMFTQAECQLIISTCSRYGR